MAEPRWTNGGGNGNFSTATNWHTGTAPVAADSIAFNRLFLSNISAGLSTGLTGASALADCKVQEGYTGLIGVDSGSPLIADFTDGTGQVIFHGSGAAAMFLQGAIDELTLDSKSTATPCFWLGGGSKTCALAILRRGAFTLGASCTITEMRAMKSGAYAGGPLIALSGGVVTAAYMEAGYCAASILPGTLQMTGGRWLQNLPASGTLTTLSMFGGMFEWRIGGQTITTLNLYGDAHFKANEITENATITTINVYSPNVTLEMVNGGRISNTTFRSFAGDFNLISDQTYGPVAI